ncbi:MAG: aminotransferase class V-fold PLP-dependent enzyme [Gemmatimonadota bacterium]
MESVPLGCLEHEFQLPADLHYLNCAYMSPQHRAVADAGMAGLLRKNDPTTIGVEDFFAESDRVRTLFAQLARAPDPARIAIQPSVSYTMSIAARHLLRGAGRSSATNVVLTAEQFPSNVHVWRKHAERLGLQVRAAAPPASGSRGEAWNDRVFAAIDEGTAVVALPHVHWTDGTRFDLDRIGRRAREVGAALVVDGTQSLGALPFDVGTVQPDLLVAAGYKWLMGPYSTALAFFGPRFDDAEPLEETWLGRSGSERFSELTSYVDEYRPGAARFDVGERSNFILLPMLRTALELVTEWGAERIQQYCGDLLPPFVADVRELGFGIEDADWRGSHLFGLRPPATFDRTRLQEALTRRRVSVSVRGDSIRISPHLYSTREDMSALFDCLRDCCHAP